MSEAQNEIRRVPAGALRLKLGELQFGDNGEDAKTAPVRLVARAGAPIEHWFWGKVVHDFAGMRHKNRIPIDYVHDDKEVIGYVNHFDFASGDLDLSGALVPFKDSDRATEIIHKNRLGVPYEASIDFRDSLEMKELKRGESQMVNGQMVEGPATVITSWTLRGVAICPYGADPNTSSQAMSSAETFTASVQKEQVMAEKVTESTPVEAPAVPQFSAADALKAFGTDGAVWFAEGKTFAEMQQLHAGKETERWSKIDERFSAVEKTIEEKFSAIEQRLTALASSGGKGEEKPVEFGSGEQKDQTRKGFASRIRISQTTAA